MRGPPLGDAGRDAGVELGSDWSRRAFLGETDVANFGRMRSEVSRTVDTITKTTALKTRGLP